MNIELNFRTMIAIMINLAIYHIICSRLLNWLTIVILYRMECHIGLERILYKRKSIALMNTPLTRPRFVSYRKFVIF